MIYRIKQFIQAISAKMAVEDIEFVKSYLSKKEQELFFQLKIYEQSHSLRVAKNMIKEDGSLNAEDKRERIRIGLLHDIGKIKYPLNPIEKSIIVVLDKITGGRISKARRLKIVKCYYEHPQLGYELLSEIGGYEVEFLQAIKNHHEPQPRTEKVRLLKQCDDAA